MSFGKMNTFLSIVKKRFTQDEDGFKTDTDVTVAEVRAYREGRHGSEKWANMASFSTATVTAQSVAEGEQVQQGTVITLTFVDITNAETGATAGG